MSGWSCDCWRKHHRLHSFEIYWISKRKRLQRRASEGVYEREKREEPSGRMSPKWGYHNHTVTTTTATANLHSRSTLAAPLTSHRSFQSQGPKIHRTQVVHVHGEPTSPWLLRFVMRVYTLAQSLMRCPDSSQKLGSDTVRLVQVSQVENTYRDNSQSL